MSIPIYLQTYLASYDLTRMSVERDKDIIITEILNKGDEEALKWLTSTYSKEEVKQMIVAPTRGMWMKRTLQYWMNMLDVTLDKEIFNKAILNLNP
jgi:hypothetical protein